MDLIAVVALAILLLGFILELKGTGQNADSGLSALIKIHDLWTATPLERWGEKYKETLKNLGSTAFNSFKVRGIRRVEKDPLTVSRGFDKLRELMLMTKIIPSGHVLSLCCGRGGWEQAYASSPGVTRVTAVTLGAGPGHEGHENYTQNSFPGREKVKVTYADATTYPTTPHDTLLFDGGESHSDYEHEARRFNRLFSMTVMRQIYPGTKSFILKVLTPTHPETIKMLKEIQSVTGKGALYRVAASKNTTLELYFVSTKIGALDATVKALLKATILRAIEGRKLKPRKIGPEYTYYREPVQPTEIKILEPMDMEESVKQLGPRVPEQGRNYNHWENMGVYPVGIEGNAGMKYNRYGLKCAHRLIPSLRGFDDWKLTDTTPKGFIEVFNRKVDVPPKENHKYHRELRTIYQGLAKYFRKIGYVHKEMGWEELMKNANPAGAPGCIDKAQSVKEFMEQPGWCKEVEKIRKSLREGKPVGCVFNTMGKREKKESKHVKGSRMIAFLPIATRLLEMKIFGNLLKLTKPTVNRFGVGGMGLHDLGERIAETWLGKGVSNDIAGFDTRVGLVIQSLECEFIRELCNNENLKEDVENLYRIYAYPHILIPIPSEFRRSELLAGRGQRMSGTNPTYSMNTITRLAIFLLELGVSLGERITVDWVVDVMQGSKGWNKRIAGCISGDDATFTTQSDQQQLSMTGEILEEVGFPRKNMHAGQRAQIADRIEEVDFCSHHYERISFMDATTGDVRNRWMPTRNVTEIVSKSLIRVGGQDRDLDEQAWLSAQGNNLLVNYPHLRTTRALGFAYKAIVHPNAILRDTGGFLRPKPWMREGDLLDVFNEVMFGESTHYPMRGFRVRSWSHVGYLPPKREIVYDPETFGKKRSYWRAKLLHDVELAVYELGTRGDTTILSNWRVKRYD
ncbi:NS5-like protein [Wuhan flea virus]|uniref:NS5-like protein n=1 Tax=Wuhan flea virus TaxID=1746071 RepID=UPI000705A69D|nr:NS5-like protein [Wuhan flea virus]ALL52910.1 NS5-like protein [Wuhan flea virus]